MLVGDNMSEFSIRSMEFRNVTKLPNADSTQMLLVGVSTDTRDFAKIAVNDLISSKIAAGDGITVDYNTSDRKYHIGKDYTTRELNQLNLIDLYLSRMTNASCIQSQCTSYCVAVTTSVTVAPNFTPASQDTTPDDFQPVIPDYP